MFAVAHRSIPPDMGYKPQAGLRRVGKMRCSSGTLLPARQAIDETVRMLSVRMLMRATTSPLVWGASVRPKAKTRITIIEQQKTKHNDEGEARDTRLLLSRAPSIGLADPASLAPVARRWGVPLAAIMRSKAAKRGPMSLLRFYNRKLRGKTSDARVCLLLSESLTLPRAKAKLLGSDVIGGTNSELAGELMYAITGAHGNLPGIQLRLLKTINLSNCLAKHERTGAWTDSIIPMAPGRMHMLISDLKECAKNNRISFGKLCAYCAERNLLTARAVSGVFSAHVKQPSVGMTRFEFAQLFAALVECGKPSSIRYWFWVLDADGDGYLGRQDIADFYRARKFASESKNGVRLASARALWFRFIDMVGSDKIDLRGLLNLTSKQREFLLVALLVRRPDDGHLVDLKQSLPNDS